MGRWQKILMLCAISILSTQFSITAQQKNYSHTSSLLATKQAKQLIFLAVLALLVHKAAAPGITFPPTCFVNESMPLPVVSPLAETFSMMHCYDASILLPSACHNAALNVFLILTIAIAASLMAHCIGGT